MSRKKEYENKTVNFLELIPAKTRDWQETNGEVIILVPKFESRLSRWLLKFMSERNFKLKLDRYGSFLWKKIDEKKNIEEIGSEFKKEFGEEVEPLYERLRIFFGKMEKSKLVELKRERIT
jgi:hypothetical protein